MPARDYTINYRINGLPEAAAGLQGVNAALAQNTGAAGTAGTSLAGLTTSMVAYTAAAAVAKEAIGAIGDALRESRDIAADLARENLKIRDTLRELANIKGDKGPTDAVVGDRMKFMLQTGMEGKEATKFMEGFEGAIFSAKQKGFIDDNTARDFEAVAGQTAMRTGLPGEAAGRFAALLATQGPMGSAEGGAARMETVVQLLNKAPAKLSGLFPALTNVVGDIVQEGGNVENIEEAAAILSVANEKRMHPSMAANMMRHAMRGVMKLRLSPQQKLGEFGLTGREDFTTIFERMAPTIKKGGQDWLLDSMGLNNVKDREAFLAFASTATTPDTPGGKSLLRQRIEEARAEGDGAGAMDRNRAFLDTTLTGRNAMAERQKEAAEFLQGQQGEGSNIYKAQAEATLRARGELDTFGSMALDRLGDLGGLTTQFGLRSTREDRILAEAQRLATADASRRGVAGPQGLPPQMAGLGFDPVQNIFRAGRQALETMGGKTREEDLTDTLNRVIGATETNATLREIRDLLAKGINPGLPKPPPPPPAGSPVRPKT